MIEMAIEFFKGCLHDCGNPAFIELAIEALREKQERSKGTVDAVEVVHGEWDYMTYDSAGNELHRCSHCKKFSHIKSDFCPNCGAKMGGEHHD